jgi:hypothetical protein
MTSSELFIGASTDSTLFKSSGSVYIYSIHRPYNSFTLAQKIYADDSKAYMNFGCSLSTVGNRLAIGADGDSILDFRSGSVFIYIYNPATFR